MKNPLSSIKTLAKVERVHARDLDFILGEVDRLNRTVQQLLSFARPAPPREDEVNISELLELTADVLSREHSAAGIRIEHCIEPQLTLHKSNGEVLQVAVLNVLLNAIQVSPAGSTLTGPALPPKSQKECSSRCSLRATRVQAWASQLCARTSTRCAVRWRSKARSRAPTARR